MKQVKSSPRMLSKVLFIIPVAMLALPAFATPEFVIPIDSAVCDTEIKDTLNNDPIVEFPEVMAEFPGGMSEMFAWMSKNVHYPELAQNYKVQGRVLVRFEVERDGRLSNIKIVKGMGDAGEIITTAYKAQDETPEEISKENLDKARIALQDEAVRVVESMPNWKPATVGGHPARVRFTLPISFRLR